MARKNTRNTRKQEESDDSASESASPVQTTRAAAKSAPAKKAKVYNVPEQTDDGITYTALTPNEDNRFEFESLHNAAKRTVASMRDMLTNLNNIVDASNSTHKAVLRASKSRRRRNQKEGGSTGSKITTFTKHRECTSNVSEFLQEVAGWDVGSACSVTRLRQGIFLHLSRNPELKSKNKEGEQVIKRDNTLDMVFAQTAKNKEGKKLKVVTQRNLWHWIVHDGNFGDFLADADQPSPEELQTEKDEYEELKTAVQKGEEAPSSGKSRSKAGKKSRRK